MYRSSLLGLIIVAVAACSTGAAHAQGDRNLRPWWVGAEAGEGQLNLTSDQIHRNRAATFALGFLGGHRLGERARIGLELNGWLLQPFNLYDPTVGESVSNVLGIGDVFPIRKLPLFVRFGAGLALYQNNRPLEFGGSGWSWTSGLGYELRLGDGFGLAPSAGYASGHFGDVNNIITVETGRRYSVVEFKLAAIWHIGKPR